MSSPSSHPTSHTLDPEELKLKYREIAALKKSIEEKQRLKNLQVRIIQKRNAMQQKKVQKQQMLHRNMSLVMNNLPPPPPSLLSLSLPNNNMRNGVPVLPSGYVNVISKGGMSLYNSNAYQERTSELQEIRNKKKQAKLLIKQQQKEQKRITRIQNRIAKLKVLCDSCDRIEVNGEKLSVNENGRQLVPLAFPQVNKPGEIEWHNHKYVRNLNGIFKSASKSKRGYVSFFSLIWF